MLTRLLIAGPLVLLGMSSRASAEDYFLTIGGGYSPSGNQASIEKNVLFYQRVLKEQRASPAHQAVYFADGLDATADLQVLDAQSVPKANRLMAEFFGSEEDLGLTYRNHQIPNVRGSTNPANIRQWFREAGPSMRRGDRLILYVTAHGGRSTDRDNPYQTSIALWDDEAITLTELVKLLDQLPDEISVVAVMVQCYTGGFARFIYNNGDPDLGLSKQQRCGFYATVHDRVAAGCTPDVDKASYVEYSSYFWAALGGRTQSGEPLAPPDYNGDGRVTFDEAHAYTVLKADTIDLPLKTSDEFLSNESQFADAEHPDLLPEDAPYETVRDLATPAERAILDALSAELGLEGSARIEAARRDGRESPRRSRRRSSGGSSRRRVGALRREITGDLEERWPELSNVLNPVAIQLLTTRSQEFIAAVEQHPRYREYREQQDAAELGPDPQKRRVKMERFVATAEDVILRENLRRLGDQALVAQYAAIVAAEATSLSPLPPKAIAGAAASR